MTAFLMRMRLSHHARMTKMKVRRQELKLSQQAVGYLSNVSAADVCRIENRRMIPYPTQAEKLGRVLKLSPAELQEAVTETR